MAWTREQMAQKAAQELQDGFYVNLGIGLPTLVANYVDADTDILAVALPQLGLATTGQ